MASNKRFMALVEVAPSTSSTTTTAASAAPTATAATTKRQAETPFDSPRNTKSLKRTFSVTTGLNKEVNASFAQHHSKARHDATKSGGVTVENSPSAMVTSQCKAVVPVTVSPQSISSNKRFDALVVAAESARMMMAAATTPPIKEKAKKKKKKKKKQHFYAVRNIIKKNKRVAAQQRAFSKRRNELFGELSKQSTTLEYALDRIVYEPEWEEKFGVQYCYYQHRDGLDFDPNRNERPTEPILITCEDDQGQEYHYFHVDMRPPAPPRPSTGSFQFPIRPRLRGGKKRDPTASEIEMMDMMFWDDLLPEKSVPPRKLDDSVQMLNLFQYAFVHGSHSALLPSYAGDKYVETPWTPWPYKLSYNDDEEDGAEYSYTSVFQPNVTE
jgi:hypothetical protein